MKFVNLTPHVINLNNGNAYPVSGLIARVSAGYSEFDAQGICVATFGEVSGLPEPQPETMYIVSGMVAGVVKGRDDVISPATGHMDCMRKDGQVISVPGFLKSSAGAKAEVQLLEETLTELYYCTAGSAAENTAEDILLKCRKLLGENFCKDMENDIGTGLSK